MLSIIVLNSGILDRVKGNECLQFQVSCVGPIIPGPRSAGVCLSTEFLRISLRIGEYYCNPLQHLYCGCYNLQHSYSAAEDQGLSTVSAYTTQHNITKSNEPQPIPFWTEALSSSAYQFVEHGDSEGDRSISARSNHEQDIDPLLLCLADRTSSVTTFSEPLSKSNQRRTDRSKSTI